MLAEATCTGCAFGSACLLAMVFARLAPADRHTGNHENDAKRHGETAFLALLWRGA